MKKYISLFLLTAIAVLMSANASERVSYTLKKGWKFTKGDVAKAASVTFDDSAWESVTVPHDWAIYGPFDKAIDLQKVAIVQNGETVPTEKTGRTGALPYIGVGWYRTVVDVPDFDAATKKAVLYFDGAMSEARVYVNGEEVGYWPNGYNSFWFDVTRYLKSGKNQLAVRLENVAESSRWYPGAGLYRNVHLEISDAVSVAPWGTFITTDELGDGFARLGVEVEVDGAKGRMLKVETRLLDANGQEVAACVKEQKMLSSFVRDELTVENPQLWTPETPALYSALTSIYENGTLKDTYTTRVGIRKIEWKNSVGVLLNSEPVKFRGVCLHHDLGPLGAAVNKAAVKRQLAIMQDMGANAIRTAHNMPAPEQIELCDEMGLMVMAESFDEWGKAKCKNGYNRFFDEWAERDLQNLIRRFRNHPSIVMWSVGNEVPEQSTPNGNRVAHRLQEICHRADPTRPVTCGLDQVDNALKNNFAAVFDIPGLNYRTHKYRDAYKVVPQGFILGSETASTVSSRGVYHFPVEELKSRPFDDIQCSSYDVEACRWSNIPEDDWMLQDDEPWVIGEFVWTGFDYLGEPTPYDEVWPSRSSYFGICDLAGLPKDRYYLYRSHWNKDEHTLHLLPHWNWKGRESEVTPVFCYTDYPSAELFVNGKSQGIRKKDTSVREHRYRLRWDDVVYEPGNIRVVAYDEKGNAVAEKTVNTASSPYRVLLDVDRDSLAADGEDLAFVTVSIVDRKGNLCPDANVKLEFAATGAVSYRAACNGDATSLEQFHLPTMHTFNGQLVVVVQAKDVAGKGELTVKGKGLKAGKISIQVK